MDSTLYVDGVLVTAPSLQNTETTKAFHIKLNRLHNWETGIRKGLVLTVNAVNQQRVDLTAGDGYAPNGEWIEIPSGVLNTPMADPSLGAVNFVYAFYTELQQLPMPHETNGTAPNTASLRSFTLQVLTAAQFAVLPQSDNAYQQFSKDRAMLIGIVTGTGGSLNAGSIQQVAEWRALNFATVTNPVIPGVSVVSVSDTTVDGSNGQLIYATGPSSLAWQSPGSVGPGAAVLVVADGILTLTALDGSTIQVNVVISGLSISAQTANVVISSIYGQTVPRESNTDRHHRSLVGSGIPTPQNPHGMSINDIAPGFVDELRNHQELEHTGGIWRGSSPTFLLCSINEVPNPNTLLVQGPVGADTYYVFGKRLTSIVNTTVTFTDATVGAGKELYEIYVDSSGNVLKSKRALFTTAVLTGADNNIVYVDPAIPAGANTITFTRVASDAVGGNSLRLNNGPSVVIPPDPPDGNYLLTLRDGKHSVKYFIAHLSNLPQPVGTYTDNLTINAAVDQLAQDDGQFLVLGQVCWNGTVAGKLGYTANRGSVGYQAQMADVRQFGNVQAFHFRDDTLLDEIHQPLADHSPDGVVIGFFDDPYAGSLNVSLDNALNVKANGSGRVYVRGRRFDLTGISGIPILPNSSTLVYIDEAGTFQTIAMSANPAFLANNKQLWLDSSGKALYGAALAVVTTSLSSIIDIVDMRRNLSGGSTSIEPWSVGDATTMLFGEFMSLRGALYYAYASYTASSGIPSLHILRTVVSEPIYLTHDITLWGGVIALEDALVVGDVGRFIAGSGGQGIALTIRDMAFMQHLPMTPNATQALFLCQDAGASVTLQNVRFNNLADLSAIVRVVIGSGVTITDCVYTTTTGATQGPFVDMLVNSPVVIRNLQLREGNSIDSLVRVSSGGSGLSNLRIDDCSCTSGTPLVKMVGNSPLGDSSIKSCYYFAPVVLGVGGTGAINNTQVSDSVFVAGGPWPQLLNNTSFKSCGFLATTLANPQQVFFDSCNFTSLSLTGVAVNCGISNCNIIGTISLVTMISCKLTGLVVSGTLIATGGSIVSSCLDKLAVTGNATISSLTTTQVLNSNFSGHVSIDNSTGSTLENCSMVGLYFNVSVDTTDVVGCHLSSDGSGVSVITAPANVTDLTIQRCKIDGDISSTFNATTVRGFWIDRNKMGGRLFLYGTAGSYLDDIDLHVTNNDFTDATGATVLNIDACSNVWITGNTFRNIHLNASIGTVSIGNTTSTARFVHIKSNIFNVVDPGPGAFTTDSWARTVISIKSLGIGTGLSGYGCEVSDNQFIDDVDATNPPPFICVSIVVPPANGFSDFRCQNNSCEFVHEGTPIATYSWKTPAYTALGAVPVLAARIALLAVLDNYPNGYGASSVDTHGSKLLNSHIVGNKIAAVGPATQWLTLVAATLGPSDKVVLTGGPTTYVEGTGAPTLSLND